MGLPVSKISKGRYVRSFFLVETTLDVHVSKVLSFFLVETTLDVYVSKVLSFCLVERTLALSVNRVSIMLCHLFCLKKKRKRKKDPPASISREHWN